MSRPDQLREFLRSRRARVKPRDVGLPTRADGRRVKGLRREELALLAGVSVDYYTRMEQGRVGNVSDQVLASVAGVLRLDAEELRHLRELVNGQSARPAAQPTRPRAALRTMLATLDPVPTFLLTNVLDIVAANRMATAITTDFDALPRAERNEIRWIFCDPAARDVFPDWEDVAGECAAWLRGALGRAGGDPRPAELVADLTANSPDFVRHWAEHRVTYCTYGVKRMHHPKVGTMTLNWESFEPTADPDLKLVVYTAPAGSPSSDMLRALADLSG